MNAHSSDSNTLIASADCETESRSPGSGSSLCNSLGLRYFPDIRYGTPGNLQSYDGGRDYSTLEAFVKQHAGPSPGPSPPTPPSPPPSPPSPTPPSPPPAPSSSHYEHPPCQSDEQEVEVQGLSGSLCSPSCTYSQCPSDKPTGVSASPQCILQDSSGYRYCALECYSDSDCDTDGGASCGSLGSFGICTYPESSGNGLPPKTCPKVLAPVKKVMV